MTEPPREATFCNVYDDGQEVYMLVGGPNQPTLRYVITPRKASQLVSALTSTIARSLDEKG